MHVRCLSVELRSSTVTSFLAPGCCQDTWACFPLPISSRAVLGTAATPHPSSSSPDEVDSVPYPRCGDEVASKDGSRTNIVMKKPQATATFPHRHRRPRYRSSAGRKERVSVCPRTGGEGGPSTLPDFAEPSGCDGATQTRPRLADPSPGGDVRGPISLV